jgi:acetylornithine/N-succinyldiaminopimelate aminotransferase
MKDRFPKVYMESPVTVVGEEFPNYLIAKDGKRYVDFLSQDGSSFLHAYGTNTAPGRNERRVLRKAFESSVAVANFYNEDRRDSWAEVACEATGYEQVFPMCSGSEVNEAAIKWMLRRHFLKTGRDGVIVSLNGCYFGRTIAANTASAGNDDAYTRGIGKFGRIRPTNIENFIDTMEAFASYGLLAGVMLETLPSRPPMLQRGFLHDSFVYDVFNLCRKTGALVMVDEIKTGGGRMGQVLSSHDWRDRLGLRPDIVTMSKTLAAGLPMAAMFADKDIFEGADHNWHLSTMAGNPAMCEYSEFLFGRLMSERVLDMIQAKGEYLQNILSTLGVKWVGRGMHLSLFFDHAFAVKSRLHAAGFLVYGIRDSYITIMPNMYTTMQQIEEFGIALAEAM